MLNKKFLPTILCMMMLGISMFLYHAHEMNNTALVLDVFVSSDSLLQADTLLVVVKNETGQITGKLGEVKMHFYRSEDDKDWVSVVGMPVNKKTGTYKLLINIVGKASFKKDITVSKRTFPVTKLVITPQLLEKGFTDKKIINTIGNDENKQLDKVLNVLNPTVYFAKPFIYPLSLTKVVGRFGDIRSSKDYKIQHLGVDLKAPLNTPIYAVNDGKVVFVKSLPDYGNTLIIDHGLGIYSLYLHLAEFKASQDHMVKQKDIIGFSGDTGYATGPHLHFSIKVRGAALDPLKFIEATQTNW